MTVTLEQKRSVEELKALAEAGAAELNSLRKANPDQQIGRAHV